MKTSAKHTCRQLAGLLEQYGVTDIVVSPGTRNAPIVMALHRSGAYRLHHCVDERSAAFRALGLAVASGRPVAMTCTSGTAMLNYGPAMAEAFYSRVPLIAITADRPARWIDQRDSQTIRQHGAMDAYVRCAVDIADDCDPGWSNRLINDALHAATGNIPGPVHINVQLDAPLTGEVDADPTDGCRKIEVFRPAPDVQSIEAFIRGILSPCEDSSVGFHAPKVMLFICGMMPHEAEAIRPLLKELRTSGIAIVPEIQSSLTDCATVTAGALEAALQRREVADDLYPDVLITLGGSAVSATIKAWLRRCPTLRHISVGYDDNTVDTYGHLAVTVDSSPAAFLAALSAALSAHPAAQA
ncbi:MAG: 2-succinyl-5-enolpyruvyl-6-hydroxy-3-cyclohexene-1-carboxylic-acid synthase, partial [Muribaculaceae bacterium]|nr:2-succinyl-5-enolpyruvyl-6-hydroxy-3-cyclohexene-1-carboxylic-acid synthase [Muribaculaceae bacterium]